MKKFILITSIAACIGMVNRSYSQTFSGLMGRGCGTHAKMEEVFKADPAARTRFEAAQKEQQAQFEKQLKQQAISKNNVLSQQKTTETAVYTVPVVVHVVLPAAILNSVTDAQIASQIDVLNSDYGGTNADLYKVPSTFASTIGHGKIRFEIAKRTVAGATTTGIIRIASNANFQGNTHPTSVSTAWDTKKYLNIWVVNLGSDLLGYSFLPGTYPVGDGRIGFVNNYTCFGTQGTAVAPFNLGRTATHEIGHFFNLEHIWGGDDTNPSCIDGDFVPDTKSQYTATYGTYSPGAVINDNCQPAPSTGIMWMNYMDYVDDNSMNFFTNGQVTKMYTALTTSPDRNTLLTSDGAIPTTVVNEVGFGGSITPSNGSSICSNSLSPSISIKNNGSATLTSAVINYSIDGGATSTYNWSGSVAKGATVTVSLPAISNITVGEHEVYVCVSSPNGQIDEYPANNCASSTFTRTSLVAANLPNVEGFENAFPNTALNNWKIINPDGGITWEKVTTAAKTGTASAKIDFVNYSSAGAVDYLVSPMINFLSANISFDYAYRPYSTSATYADKLEVVVSEDCGNTWTSLWSAAGTSLASVAGVENQYQFVPTAAQWTTNSYRTSPSVSLNSYANKYLYVALKATNAYGNNLYVDNISITGTFNPTATPVNLAYFKGTARNKTTNVLDWKTASETNTSYFKIERSVNGTDFEAIGEVAAKGTTTTETTYGYTDYTVSASLTYYRLKTVDKDGTTSYSNIISIKANDKAAAIVSIFPNPVKDKLNVTIQSETVRNTTLKVIDIQGRVLATKNITLQVGGNLTSIEANSLPKGLYMLVVDGTEKQTIKFTKD